VKLWFGKYEGMEVRELPDSYLAYILDYQKKNVVRESQLITEVEKEIDFRENAHLAELSVAEQIITAGYKALAAKLHPDAGGDHDKMVELNASAEKLRHILLEEADR
jgi:hypothetical protein